MLLTHLSSTRNMPMDDIQEYEMPCVYLKQIKKAPTTNIQNERKCVSIDLRS